jgi:hypothetical protein
MFAVIMIIVIMMRCSVRRRHPGVVSEDLLTDLHHPAARVPWRVSSDVRVVAEDVCPGGYALDAATASPGLRRSGSRGAQ